MIITRSIISGASSKNVDIADRRASQIASSFNFLSQYSQQLGSSFLRCFSALLMSLLLKPLLHLQYSLRHVSHSTRNFLQISFNAKWQSHIQLINKLYTRYIKWSKSTALFTIAPWDSKIIINNNNGDSRCGKDVWYKKFRDPWLPCGIDVFIFFCIWFAIWSFDHKVEVNLAWLDLI